MSGHDGRSLFLGFGKSVFADTDQGIQFFTNAVNAVANVPTPGTAALLGLGLAAVGAVRRRAR